MRRALVPFLALPLVLALASCGGDSSGASGGDCVILSNGNKLCGADATTYCESFTAQTDDVASLAACKEAGADVSVPLTDDERNQRAYNTKVAGRERDVAKAIAPFVPDTALGTIGTSYGDGAIISTFYTSDPSKVGEKADRNHVTLPAPSQDELIKICDAVIAAIPDAPGPKRLRAYDGSTLAECGDA